MKKWQRRIMLGYGEASAAAVRVPTAMNGCSNFLFQVGPMSLSPERRNLELCYFGVSKYSLETKD
jgi:hypothetical protein